MKYTVWVCDMKLVDIMSIADASIDPDQCKVHLACWNGKIHPIDVFLAGGFEEWQARQSKRNFQKKYVVSLIELPERSRWLFAGCYEVFGCSAKKNKNNRYMYETREIQCFSEYSGRIVVEYEKKFRQSYPNLTTIMQDLIVVELKPEKVAVSDFPGFSNVLISHRVLQAIVSQEIESWRSVLSNVKGIYAIVDKSNGKVYVGSATGEDMIWQRWSEYARTGHGGNKILRRLVRENGNDYPMNYQYTILEIADSHACDKDILARESFWKNTLCSRDHGYNEN